MCALVARLSLRHEWKFLSISRSNGNKSEQLELVMHQWHGRPMLAYPPGAPNEQAWVPQERLVSCKGLTLYRTMSCTPLTWLHWEVNSWVRYFTCTIWFSQSARISSRSLWIVRKEASCTSDLGMICTYPTSLMHCLGWYMHVILVSHVNHLEYNKMESIRKWSETKLSLYVYHMAFILCCCVECGQYTHGTIRYDHSLY